MCRARGREDSEPDKENPQASVLSYPMLQNIYAGGGDGRYSPITCEHRGNCRPSRLESGRSNDNDPALLERFASGRFRRGRLIVVGRSDGSSPERHQGTEHRRSQPCDCWTWTAIDADSKLCVSWLTGSRDSQHAYAIMCDIKSRMSQRIQLTTDQLSIYLKAVDKAFGVDVDYAMLQKIYAGGGDGRYSPAECIGCKKVEVTGSPDPEHISTSFVERSNLSMRMSIRRFTRLTNAVSRKVENHSAAVALYFFWYNFGRVHQTLRVTPAMEAGVSDHVWSVEEIVRLLG